MTWYHPLIEFVSHNVDTRWHNTQRVLQCRPLSRQKKLVSIENIDPVKSLKIDRSCDNRCCCCLQERSLQRSEHGDLSRPGTLHRRKALFCFVIAVMIEDHDVLNSTCEGMAYR